MFLRKPLLSVGRAILLFTFMNALLCLFFPLSARAETSPFADRHLPLAPAPVRFENPPTPNLYLTAGEIIRWTTSPSIDSYRLTLGSSVGAFDYHDTGEMRGGTYACPVLPVGVPIYARVQSHWQDTWYCTDIVFYAHATFQYPLNGTMNVENTRSLAWSPGGILKETAPKYTLSMGTTPTGTDILPPTALQQNGYPLTRVVLPKGIPIYATVSILLGDRNRRFASTVFATPETPQNPVSLLYPQEGEQNVDVSNPFSWQETDLATGYRLQILSKDAVVRDSGVVSVPRYFASDLPVGDYTASLSAQIAGKWLRSSRRFHVSKTGGSIEKEIETALWATDRVRKMALAGNYTFQHTPLWKEIVKYKKAFNPFCTQYAFALLTLERQMNIGCASDADKQPRTLDIAFITGNTTHILNEYYHRGLGRWILLDPTFGLTPLRASDGTYASKEDMQKAVLQQDWNAITYKFLGEYGNAWGKGYYIDYPLLYLNVGNPLTPQGTGNSPLPYLVKAKLPFSLSTNFLLRSPSKSVTLVLNGVKTVIAVLGLDNTSWIYKARSIDNPNNEDVTIYLPVRNHF